MSEAFKKPRQVNIFCLASLKPQNILLLGALSNVMKETDYIKEFESQYSGRRDKSKRMDIYPPPRSSYPLVIDFVGGDVGCVYLHYDQNMRESAVWLMYLKAYEQGRGFGTCILRELCSLADLRSTHLYLEPAPDNDSNLKFDALVSWYRKFGFLGENVMCRAPNA